MIMIIHVFLQPRNVPLKRECSDFLEDKAKGGSRVLDSVLQVDIEDTGRWQYCLQWGTKSL
jgi:hypothetical protein